MDFDLKNLNPGTKFLFDEEDPSKGFIELRVCPTGEMKKIAAKTDRKTIEFKRGNRFEVMERDENLHDKLFWDYVIVSWDGVTNKGKALECNAKNKVMLINGSPKFNGFVADCLEKLGEDQAKIEEETEKN